MRSKLWGGLSFAGLAAMALHAPVAAAIGLGEVEVTSPLGRALDARLPLILEPGEDVEFVRVRLLPQSAYEGYGLPLPGLRPDDITPTIEKRDAGGHWLRLQSQRTIREPAIELLVEVSHGSARITRGLPLLFDVPNDAAVAVDRPSASTRPAVPAPVRAEAPRVAAAAPEPVALPAKAAPAADQGAEAGETYGPVVAGESLRTIAERVRPFPNYGLRRVMTALQIANPDAFLGGDRTPRVGSVLRVPDARTMLDLDADTITSYAGPGRASVESRPPREPAPEKVVEPTPSPVAMPDTLERIVLDLAALPGQPGIGRQLALTETLNTSGLVMLADGAVDESLSGDAEADVSTVGEDAAETETDAAAGALGARAPATDALTPQSAAPAKSEDSGPSFWTWVLALFAGAAGVYAYRRWRRADPVSAPLPPVQVPSAQTPKPKPTETAAPLEFAAPPETGPTPPPIRLVRPVPPVPGAAVSGALQVRIQRLQNRNLNADQRQKVALAAAYLDMGDETSTRQLLDEAEEPTGKGPARRA